MKVRNGFITNSSSSSFIVTIDKGEEKLLDTLITVGNKLGNDYEYKITTKEEVEEYISNRYGSNYREYYTEEHDNLIKAIENDMYIYINDFDYGEGETFKIVADALLRDIKYEILDES